MYFSRALTAFLSVHLSRIEGFPTPAIPKPLLAALSMSEHFRVNSPEWDNDDFLEALSGSPEDREEANRKYREQSERNRRLREMMASFRERREEEGEEEKEEEEEVQDLSGAQAWPSPSLGLEDEEGVVFVTQDGKVGRNRDADKIANSADMYFAQLKLDSKIRKRAFLRGDTETANKVFGDERVQKLPDELAKNPFIKSNLQRTKGDDTLGTSAQESLGPFIFTAQDKTFTDDDKRNSGISYKQKLMQKRHLSPHPHPLNQNTPSPPPPLTTLPIPIQHSAKQESPTPSPSPPLTPLTTLPPQSSPLQHQKATAPNASFLVIIDEALKLYNDAASQNNVHTVLMTLRWTLLEAMKELQKYSSEEELQDSYDPLSPSIECIQGALDMYNNADVNERKNLLQPLRGALLGAVKKIEDIANAN